MKYLIASLLFLFSNLLLAQTNYKPGFIINLKGDTIKGLIDDRNNALNAIRIVFKTSEEANTQTFNPASLKGFYTDDKYYVSSPIVNDVNNEKATSQVFLNELVRGRAILYFLKDPDHERFFVKKDTSRLIELKSEENLVVVDGETKLKTTKFFLGVFKYLFSDCPKLNLNQRDELNVHDLVKIVSDYNICVGAKENYISTRTKQRLILRPSLIVAYNRSTIKGKGVNNVLKDPVELNRFGLGASVNIFSPMLSDKFSLQAEGMVNKKGTISTETAFQFKEVYDLKPLYLDFGLLVKYQYNKGTIRPTAGFGGIYGILLNKNGAFTHTINNNAYPAFKDASGNETGWCAEAGIKIAILKNFISFTYRYERTLILFNLEDQTYNNRIHQIRLSYTL